MPFSSTLFLSLFLPAFIGMYALAPRSLRNGVALLFSVIFYAWGAPRFLPFVLALGVIDFYLARAIAERRGKAKKVLVALGVTMHLSTLAYFKYSNFFVGEANSLLAMVPSGLPKIPWREVVLPIGISFITFEEISYLVDVYRGDAAPARHLGKYLLFLMLFPHSIAGPIFRWKDLDAQLEARSFSSDDVAQGFARFTIGLAKKIVVADAVARTADAVFAMPPCELGMGVAWLGALAYTVQIYFDFSGYSDMAIGLGRMIGFRFKENFNVPYIADSMLDFWRRWHISLTTWLRDYLYRPLGGNRVSPRRVTLNIFLVFVLSGLWHGAAFTFVAWGAYHGALSILERTDAMKELRARLPKWLNVATTFALVVVGWVFFRATTIGAAFQVIAAMFSFDRPVSFEGAVAGEVASVRAIFFLVLGLAIAFAPLFSGPQGKRDADAASVPKNAPSTNTASPVGPPPLGSFRALVVTPALLLFTLMTLVNSKFSPLIYFKF